MSYASRRHTPNILSRIFSRARIVSKQSNEAVVRGFQERLEKVAGFAHVPEPLPMKNSNNAVVYYLFFASQKPVAQRIVDDIFAKYR